MIGSLKLYIITAVAALGLMITIGIIGNFLMPHLPQEWLKDPEFGKKLKIGFLYFYFILFLIIGFSLMPITVKIPLDFQIKIGNGEIPFIKFLYRNSMNIVYIFWGIFVLGIVIAAPHIHNMILKD